MHWPGSWEVLLQTKILLAAWEAAVYGAEWTFWVGDAGAPGGLFAQTVEIGEAASPCRHPLHFTPCCKSSSIPLGMKNAGNGCQHCFFFSDECG